MCLSEQPDLTSDVGKIKSRHTTPSRDDICVITSCGRRANQRALSGGCHTNSTGCGSLTEQQQQHCDRSRNSQSHTNKPSSENTTTTTVQTLRGTCSRFHQRNIQSVLFRTTLMLSGVELDGAEPLGGGGGLQGYLNLQNLVALEPKNPHDKLKMQS